MDSLRSRLSRFAGFCGRPCVMPARGVSLRWWARCGRFLFLAGLWPARASSWASRLVSVAIEDILGVADQINVPGTVVQYPNWRRRWPVPLEALADDPRLHRIADVLAKAGRSACDRS